MLTIFSTPKPFRGHFGIIQMNAIQSWLRLHNNCEIILLGNEEGTAKTAKHFKIRHVPEITCNKWGTPLVSALFDKAQKIATNQILCYVNADIILMSDFIQAIKRIRRGKSLIVGQRWDLEINEPLHFDLPGWEDSLKSAVLEHGAINNPTGLDYFVFRKGVLGDILPFSVGRPGWDNWMIYRARFLGIPVIDATPSVIAVHQNHDYSHHYQGKEGAYNGPEAEANLNLLGGGAYAFTLWDATKILKPGGLRPALTRKHIKRRLDTLLILYPKRSLRARGIKLLFSALLSLHDWLSRQLTDRAVSTI